MTKLNRQAKLGIPALIPSITVRKNWTELNSIKQDPCPNHNHPNTGTGTETFYNSRQSFKPSSACRLAHNGWGYEEGQSCSPNAEGKALKSER